MQLRNCIWIKKKKKSDMAIDFFEFFKGFNGAELASTVTCQLRSV